MAASRGGNKKVTIEKQQSGSISKNSSPNSTTALTKILLTRASSQSPDSKIECDQEIDYETTIEGWDTSFKDQLDKLTSYHNYFSDISEKPNKHVSSPMPHTRILSSHFPPPADTSLESILSQTINRTEVEINKHFPQLQAFNKMECHIIANEQTLSAYNNRGAAISQLLTSMISNLRNIIKTAKSNSNNNMDIYNNINSHLIIADRLLIRTMPELEIAKNSRERAISAMKPQEHSFTPMVGLHV